jgi:hypothetical protein
VSGVVVNRTWSQHVFVVTPKFEIAGRVAEMSDSVSEDVEVPAAGAKAWRWTDGFTAGEPDGPITACTPSLRVAPPGD